MYITILYRITGDYKCIKHINIYIAFYNYDYLHDKTMLYVRIVKNKTVRLCS